MENNIDLYINRFLEGDAYENLLKIPSKSVNTCITSPPYFKLRDYGTAEWTGGKENCDHLKVTDYKKNIGNGKRGQEHGYIAKQSNNNICSKCGAIRYDKQMGLENTPEEYVTKLIVVLNEVYRVLRDDGTLWLNLGDSYAGAGGSSGHNEHTKNLGAKTSAYGAVKGGGKKYGLKAKDLIGIPWRTALALQGRAVIPFMSLSEWVNMLDTAIKDKDWELVKIVRDQISFYCLKEALIKSNWYLRQDIIWYKPNPMPESVEDRCTKSHEYIFLLSKSKKYYYDHVAIMQDVSYASIQRLSQDNIENQNGSYTPSKGYGNMKAVSSYRGSSFDKGKTGEMKFTRGHTKSGNLQRKDRPQAPEGNNKNQKGSVPWEGMKANKRSVWPVTTKPFKGAHFATFPQDLITDCIKAGCPEQVCSKCKTPRQKIYTIPDIERKGSDTKYEDGTTAKRLAEKRAAYREQGLEGPPAPVFSGYTDCGCNAPFEPGIVLDCFSGAGTTPLETKSLGRNFIAIELNPKNIALSKKRMRESLGLFYDVKE